MQWLMVLPFFLQAVCILIDEIVFHVPRGLPLWERIGHPIDTLGTLVCLVFVLYVPFSSGALKTYTALAIFSSLLVTKDEFIHKHHCPWKEHWLHAVLFLLHPITLACAGCFWPIIQGIEVPVWLSSLRDHSQHLLFFLRMQVLAMGLFFFYQVIFWNFLWKYTQNFGIKKRLYDQQ